MVATGLYAYGEVPTYFRFRGPGTALGGPEPMTELFIRDINQGIGDTGVKAGVIKGATEVPEYGGGGGGAAGGRPGAPREPGRRSRPTRTRSPSAGRGINGSSVRRGSTRGGWSSGTRGTQRTSTTCDELMDGGWYLGMDRFGGDPLALLRGAGRDGRLHVRAGLRRADGALPRHMLLFEYLRGGTMPSSFPAGATPTFTTRSSPRCASVVSPTSQSTAMLVSNPRNIFSTKGGY